MSAATALLLLLTGATEPALVRVHTSGAVTIWPKGSLRAVRYCSRVPPAPAERYWTPRWRDVARAETSLPEAMAAWRAPRRTVLAADDPDLDWRYGGPFQSGLWQDGFSRNYYGLTRHGRRILYVDFARKPARDSRGICDGGRNYFGVELDLHTMRVLSFAANATA